jgi:hypothetical protein
MNPEKIVEVNIDEKVKGNEEVIIDVDNFNQYFFDVRMHAPQKGQIIVCYSTTAELIEGTEKKNLVQLMYAKKDNIMPAALQIMRKIFCASYKDSMRVLEEILTDLLSGMSIDEVCKKPYKFTAHMYFYTLPEYFPKQEDDPDKHWTKVSIVDMDKFFTSEIADGVVMETKVVKE